MASLSRDTSHTIPKLDGNSNYEIWQNLVSASLASTGGWKFIDGSAILPTREADEKPYHFQARLETYHEKAAHARMIILSTCKTHIQTSLAKTPTAKACWEKLKKQYEPQGLVQSHDLWVQFVKYQYNGEEMEAFGEQYRDTVDRCIAAGMTIDPLVQVMQFLHILAPHFDHWATNMREHLRRSPQIPTLDLLILEAKDEYKARQQTSDTLQLQLASTSLVAPAHPTLPREVCSYCKLPRDKEETCYYKHVNLRRAGWQPNTITMQRIQQRVKGNIHVQASASVPATSSPPSITLFDFVQFSYQAHSEANPVSDTLTWIADSGANHHFCNDKSILQNYIADPLSINTGSGLTISPGSGQVHLRLQRSDRSFRSVRLNAVRYMPTSVLNTLSEHLLEQKGVYWHGWESRFVARATGEEFALVKKIDGLKVLSVCPAPLTTVPSSCFITQSISLNTLHRRLAHLHVDGLKHFLSQEHINLADSTPFQPCEACALAKSSRTICRESHTRATHPFHKVHCDLVGPISTVGLAQQRYFLLVTDDYSRYRWVYFLQNNIQVFPLVKQFFAAVHNQYSSPISEFHSDNGTEFGSQAFKDFLAIEGVRVVHSAPYHHTHEGNLALPVRPKNDYSKQLTKLSAQMKMLGIS